MLRVFKALNSSFSWTWCLQKQRGAVTLYLTAALNVLMSLWWLTTGNRGNRHNYPTLSWIPQILSLSDWDWTSECQPQACVQGVPSRPAASPFCQTVACLQPYGPWKWHHHHVVVVLKLAEVAITHCFQTCYWRDTGQFSPGCSTTGDEGPERCHHWWRTGCDWLNHWVESQKLCPRKTCDRGDKVNQQTRGSANGALWELCTAL